MRGSAQPSIDFFVLITLAAVIAALGLLQNSGAVIIGAMLVAPLMSPILAMAMSMVHGNPRLFLVAAGTTAKGITLAIIVGLVVTAISPIQTATSEILSRTAPNILDLMVAMASGAAAGYAISRKEVAAALPGVAIAAALVPPLCVVGYGLGTSQLEIAAGSLLLFTTNLIAIILAAGLTFLALGFHPIRTEQHEVLRGFRLTVVFYSIIFVILAFTTVASVTKLNREARIEAIFADEVVARAAEIENAAVEHEGNGFTITATIIDHQDNQLTPAEITDIQDQLTQAVGGPVTIRATILAGRQDDYSGFAQQRELEDRFREDLVALDAQIAEMMVDKRAAASPSQPRSSPSGKRRSPMPPWPLSRPI